MAVRVAFSNMERNVATYLGGTVSVSSKLWLHGDDKSYPRCTMYPEVVPVILARHNQRLSRTWPRSATLSTRCSRPASSRTSQPLVSSILRASAMAVLTTEGGWRDVSDRSSSMMSVLVLLSTKACVRAATWLSRHPKGGNSGLHLALNLTTEPSLQPNLPNSCRKLRRRSNRKSKLMYKMRSTWKVLTHEMPTSWPSAVGTSNTSSSAGEHFSGAPTQSRIWSPRPWKMVPLA
mmetsp:Transcript_63032/g.137010  ORF Transcript_63032/g.137010 Transcript_63032/m.137010 type:complete len:234 (-) Transcript_63032:214-915(-)